MPLHHGRRRHDFDFIFGRWQVHNRRLADIANPDCTKWVEFEATSFQTG
jgi:hypothetical protein